MNSLSNAKHPVTRISRWLVLIIMATMLIGCKTANYGKFKQSREAEKIFTSGQVLSEHKYYYTGSNTRPDVVMGIHQNFTLDEEYWDKAQDIQKELKFWVGQMNNDMSAFGYYILSPDGKQIGIYYSRWSTGPVRMGENNQVIISLPDKEADTRRRGSRNE
ncbi:hypothetical protein ACFLZL_02095 [Thermodesulfobacteriota bacterium]